MKQSDTKAKAASYLSRHYGIEVNLEVPNRLFKYSRVNPYIINDLEKNHFTMSCPTLFNDLYDAAIHRNSFESRYEDEVERIALLRMCGFCEPEQIDIEKIKNDAEHEDRFLSQYMKESFRVGCLSENNTSILMWSHYADNNQGICMEYDLTNTLLQPFMYPVAYVPIPIDCSELCEIDIDLAMLLSTIVKYNIWEYEREWRMILYYPTQSNDIKNKRIQAMMPKPKAIYLGKNFLQYWIENKRQKHFSLFVRFCDYIRKNNIPLYVMKNKLMSYEFEPVTIDIDVVQRLSEGELYDKYLV